MTRSELIARLASRFPQLTQSDVAVSAATILDGIADRLAAGGRAEIRGFGSFQVNVRPPRLGRNPKTGDKVMVPAKTAPHFKAGKDLRAAVCAPVQLYHIPRKLAEIQADQAIELAGLRGSVGKEHDIISPIDSDRNAAH